MTFAVRRAVDLTKQITTNIQPCWLSRVQSIFHTKPPEKHRHRCPMFRRLRCQRQRERRQRNQKQWFFLYFFCATIRLVARSFFYERRCSGGCWWLRVNKDVYFENTVFRLSPSDTVHAYRRKWSVKTHSPTGFRVQKQTAPAFTLCTYNVIDVQTQNDYVPCIN